MTKKPYAAGTEVPAERTRNQIEALVEAAGADAFGFGIEGTLAQIRFRMHDRMLRFDLPLPDPGEARFQTIHRGVVGIQPRTPTAARVAWKQACQERWRSLLLCIKAKFAAVEAGVVTFEEEFLSHVVLPDGRTVGEVATRQLALAQEGGAPPRLLADYTGGRG